MMKKKKLIISLIKDNLINTRLLIGLNGLGFDVSNYYLHLSETILKLMEVEVSDDRYERYLSLFNQVSALNLNEDIGQLDGIAEGIYSRIKRDKI